MSLYGPTFYFTPVDCIIFQCNLYKFCIVSCEINFQIVLFLTYGNHQIIKHDYCNKKITKQFLPRDRKKTPTARQMEKAKVPL